AAIRAPSVFRATRCLGAIRRRSSRLTIAQSRRSRAPNRGERGTFGPVTHTITLIPGDGIGPEVAAATQRVLEAAGVKIAWEVHDAGAAVAEKRGTTLPNEVLDSIRKNKVALKGPIGTPIGKGFRSVNVTLRQALDLYSNVRPVRSLPSVE